ncbi:MAG: hypothetical protein KBT11_11785 [Treponema sp.]|nr:hypothetical protein [Candidatus Treponema equifaecale]
MKKSVLLSAVLGAALAANLYAFDTDVSLQLTGSVNEYTKTEYTITEKFGDYYRSPKAKYVHKFNAAGKETEASELTSKDALVDHIVYSYDAAGNLSSQVCTDVDGKIQWKITYAYDASGNKTEESEFNASDALVNKTIWKFTAGKQVEESYYNADGALLSKIITKIDEQGRTSEVCTYRADGNLDEKATYTYNDAGKLSEITFTNVLEIVTKKIVYRFDAAYQITEEQTYNAENKLIVRVIYRYDENGNITKKTTYNVAEKFGTTVNELAGIYEYSYKAGASSVDAK